MKPPAQWPKKWPKKWQRSDWSIERCVYDAGSKTERHHTHMSNIQSIVDDFANQLSALIETQVLARARIAVAAALGGTQAKRGPGRPPKLLALATSNLTAGSLGTATKKKRKKGPPQLCPVPGCKNKAAPIFGMVCSTHKDVSKAKIKEYREARRAKKAGAKTSKATKTTKTGKPGRKPGRKAAPKS